MAHSVEGRAPYLFPALVDLALNLPQPQRMTKSAAKLTLRRLACRYLPEDIVNRRKQGFVLPMRSWLEAWLQSQGPPLTYFTRRSFPHIDAIRLSVLVTADRAAGIQRERLLFAIIMLIEWWAAFQAKRSSLIRAHRFDNGQRPFDPSSTVGFVK